METITSLIPFNMVVDTDNGLVTAFYEKATEYKPYGDMIRPTFIPGLNIKPNSVITDLMINRQFKNPLTAILKPEYCISDADKLYKEYMEERYAEVIEHSPITALFSMMRRAYKTLGNALVFTVLCENELEVACIAERAKRNEFTVNIILRKDLDNLDTYGTIYVKDISELDIMTHPDSMFAKMEGKNIMIADYRFNTQFDNRVENRVPLAAVAIQLTDRNKLFFTNIYDESLIDMEG